MDTKLIGDGRDTKVMSIEALSTMALRQRRRESFYRSLLRCFAVCLLFIAAGCLLCIYSDGTGSSAPFAFLPFSPPAGVKDALKLIFLCSVLPSVCAASALLSNGSLSALSDTLAPAVYGTAAGCALYRVYLSLSYSFSFAALIRSLPGLCFTAAVILVYSLVCPVFASYGRCLRRGGVTADDPGSCFTYYAASLTALCAAVALFGLFSAFTDSFV